MEIQIPVPTDADSPKFKVDSLFSKINMFTLGTGHCLARGWGSGISGDVTYFLATKKGDS